MRVRITYVRNLVSWCAGRDVVDLPTPYVSCATWGAATTPKEPHTGYSNERVYPVSEKENMVIAPLPRQRQWERREQSHGHCCTEGLICIPPPMYVCCLVFTVSSLICIKRHYCGRRVNQNRGRLGGRRTRTAAYLLWGTIKNRTYGKRNSQYI